MLNPSKTGKYNSILETMNKCVTNKDFLSKLCRKQNKTLQVVITQLSNVIYSLRNFIPSYQNKNDCLKWCKYIYRLT